MEVGIVEADRRLRQDVSARNGDFRRDFIGSTNFGGILKTGCTGDKEFQRKHEKRSRSWCKKCRLLPRCCRSVTIRIHAQGREWWTSLKTSWWNRWHRDAYFGCDRDYYYHLRYLNIHYEPFNIGEAALKQTILKHIFLRVHTASWRPPWWSGGLHPTERGSVTKNRKMMNPMKPIMAPGIMKDIPQLLSTKWPAIREPKMLPTDVWEFQIPKINPIINKRNH